MLGTAMARRKHRQTPPPLDRGDTTPERLAKAGADAFRDGEGKRQVHDNTLFRARRREAITDKQFQAGLKYAELQYAAGLDGSVNAVDLNRIFSRETMNFDRLATTEHLAMARHDYAHVNKVLGKLGEATVTYLVCNSGSLEGWGMHLGYKNRSQAIAAAETSLRIYLEMLREFWRI